MITTNLGLKPIIFLGILLLFTNLYAGNPSKIPHLSNKAKRIIKQTVKNKIFTSCINFNKEELKDLLKIIPDLYEHVHLKLSDIHKGEKKLEYEKLKSNIENGRSLAQINNEEFNSFLSNLIKSDSKHLTVCGNKFKKLASKNEAITALLNEMECKIGVNVDIQNIILEPRYPVDTMVIDMFLVYPYLLQKLLQNAFINLTIHPYSAKQPHQPVPFE